MSGNVRCLLTHGDFFILLGLPTVRKRPVKYRYLSRIYPEIQSFMGPWGIPNYYPCHQPSQSSSLLFIGFSFLCITLQVEPFWIWVEDFETNKLYHAEEWLLHKLEMRMGEPMKVVVVINVPENAPSQFNIQVCDRKRGMLWTTLFGTHSWTDVPLGSSWILGHASVDTPLPLPHPLWEGRGTLTKTSYNHYHHTPDCQWPMVGSGIRGHCFVPASH